ncbi:ARM repeat-containing protein [Hypomontagnella monticulosa]|nr:ARM repeat-containing protein [Hypomontagnella monticulosa]
MPKPRTKRQAIRDERKAKRRAKALAAQEASKAAKRQRLEEANRDGTGDQEPIFEDGKLHPRESEQEHEFFGMLSDQEQEYFRSVDEQLDIDDFPSQEERQLYLSSVFAEAQGKELKLACSQSCSRLMERLILMSNTRQKKKLFNQFAGHFLNLVQHRFASHCCETLFLQSAPIVTRELGGERDDIPTDQDDPNETPLPSMEELFLLTLDELEKGLRYLITDRFASHTLRVLLIILSGRPLEQWQTKSLMHSKNKEHISVPWTSDGPTDLNNQLRAVPTSFNLAVKKIIDDLSFPIDFAEARVISTHPTGNPVLQLLLELDMSLNLKANDEYGNMRLLRWFLPRAPNSLQDATSPASDWVNSMLYDRVGSRLLETLITHCPGKIFKALHKHCLGDRIHSLLRNDIACYPAIRVLNRLSKEDLVAAVEKTLPEFSKYVALSRFNVIKTLFERCQARQATSEIDSLTRVLIEAIGSDPKSLVPRLCLPQSLATDDAKEQKSKQEIKSAVSHGSQLATTMLAIPGSPSQAIQTSLSALPEELILQLATSSAPTSYVVAHALTTPSRNKIFHKTLVATLRPHAFQLAMSEHGNKVLSSIISIPSKGDDTSIPFHIKEFIMLQLEQHEKELRDSPHGRRTWRAWKGDLWKNRRGDWISWAKEVDSVQEQGLASQPKGAGRLQHAYGNDSSETMRNNDSTRKRKRDPGST